MTLARQTIQSFDGIQPFGFAGNGFCSPADGGPGCGTDIGAIHGPVPPFATSGDARWTGSGYALISGLSGTGLALSAPVGCYFTFEAASSHNTLLVGCLYKVGSLASTQSVLTIGGNLVLEINTSGKWRLRTLVGATTWTSTGASAVAGTTYHVEWGTYVNAAGAFKVQINGVPMTDLNQSGVNTLDGAGSALMSAVYLGNSSGTNAVGVYDDVYIYAGAGGFVAGDFKGDATRLPRMSTLRPASQGFYSQWDRWSGNPSSTVVLIGIGNSTNYTYVDDVQCDTILTHLQSGTTGTDGFKDSYIMEGLDAEAGDIVAVQSDVCVAAGGDFRRDGYFFRIDGVDSPHADDEEFEYITPGGAQYRYSCRDWDALGLAAADLQAGVEFGSLIIGEGAAQRTTQVLLLVLWLEALVDDAPEAPTHEGACDTCDPKIDAVFMDSSISYDGRNVTVTQLQLDGATWDEGDTLTLLASSPTFVIGDVGNSFELNIRDDDGVVTDTVIVDVTAFVSAQAVTVEPRTDVPVALQGVPTAVWTKMVDSLSGIDHLEGETVAVFGDGVEVAQQVVTAGAIAMPAYAGGFDTYGIIHVGLPIEFLMRTLAIDQPGGGNSIADLKKIITQVVVHCQCSRTFEAGGDILHMTQFDVDPLAAPTALSSGKRLVNIGNRWDKNGQVTIRHTRPTPLSVLAITPVVEIGGR